MSISFDRIPTLYNRENQFLIFSNQTLNHEISTSQSESILSKSLDESTPESWICSYAVLKSLKTYPITLFKKKHLISSDELFKFNQFLIKDTVFQNELNLCRNELDKKELFLKLFSIGFNRLKDLQENFDHSMRDEIFKEEPISKETVYTLIRQSLEQNPKKEAYQFAFDLYFLITLRNSEQIIDFDLSQNQLNARIQVNQNLLNINGVNLVKICPEDILLFYHFPSCQYLSQNKKSLLEMYNSLWNDQPQVKRMQYLNKMSENINLPFKELALPNDIFNNSLSILYEMSYEIDPDFFSGVVTELQSIFQEKLIGALLKNKNFKPNKDSWDGRSKEGILFMQQLWIELGDLVYGYLGCLFPKTKFCVDCYKYLEKYSRENPLATHHTIQRSLFDKNFKNKSSQAWGFCLCLYKIWWYSIESTNRVASLVQRAIDWEIKDLIQDETVFNLDTFHFRTVLEDRFRKKYPYLPFLSSYTESAFFKLKWIKQNVKINNPSQKASTD